MRILVLAEHNNVALKSATNSVVTAASRLGGEVDVLVAGHGCAAVVAAAVALVVSAVVAAVVVAAAVVAAAAVSVCASVAVAASVSAGVPSALVFAD